jgi:hypothetical protein
MTKVYPSSFVALLAAVSLAACSGHSMGQVLPGAGSPDAVSPAFAQSNAMDADGVDKAAPPNVFIKLNKASVPKGSLSVTVTLTKVGKKAIKPPKKLVTNLTKCTKGCSVPGPVSAAGSDTFTVSVFNAKNGKGKLLRFGTVAGKVKSTKTTLTAKTLLGNVATVVVGGAALVAGAASTPAISIAATDASGNPVTGAYYKPITVTDSDTSGATTLSTGTLAASTTPLTLNYTGLIFTGATLTPGGTAVTGTPGTVTVSGGTISTVISPTPTTPNQIDLYSTSGTGSTANVVTSQAGWTGSFGKTFTFATAPGTPNPNCSTFVVTLLNNVFTVATNTSAQSAGNCTLNITGGGGQTASIKLTYTTTGIGINGKHR